METATSPQIGKDLNLFFLSVFVVYSSLEMNTMAYDAIGKTSGARIGG